MKKIFTLVLMLFLLLGFSVQSVMAADVAPEFSKKFFPSGKANVPTDIYYEINKDNSGRVKNVYVWLTQPDDVVDMFTEWNYLGRDEFEKKYGCTIEAHYIQIDSKVDDGDWHYVSEWDIDEYPQENQPYDLMIRQKIVASEEQKTYREGAALIDPFYGQDDESAGYLKPLIYTKDDKWYLDLNNHSLTLRMRYIIRYTNWNMSDDGSSGDSIVLSDWSKEITIGKNSTQKELVYPKSIEAPVISKLSFVESVEDENGYSESTWKVYVDFPKSNGDAQKYYSIEKDITDPLCAVMQYRVKTNGKWSEWKDTDWGNPSWLFSGWKTFVTEEVSKDDSIEFRAYLRNDAEEGKDSPFTKSLFSNAGDARTEKSDDGITKTATKSKCKLCGICPIQPLGICLFVWIAIILILILIIIIIAKRKNKNKSKKERRC